MFFYILMRLIAVVLMFVVFSITTFLIFYARPTHPALLTFANNCTTAPLSAQAPLKRSTPEREGVSSATILAFVQAADTSIDAMNSVMIVRHGNVIAEGWWGPYDARTPHVLYSLSKS